MPAILARKSEDNQDSLVCKILYQTKGAGGGGEKNQWMDINQYFLQV